MRAFIALEIPQNLKDSFAIITDLLDTDSATIKWVRPEHMHLTLKFLGDISEGEAKQISEGLHKTIKNVESMYLGIGGLGAFPKRKDPRVIWVGVKMNDKLIHIHEELEKLCQRAGIEPDERKFSPHLTLGRVKFMNPGSNLPKKLREADIETTFIPVNRVVLFKSTLTPQGPIYHKLSEAKLSNRPK